jgi:hypothetical protein
MTKWFIQAGWEDVPHIDESAKKAMVASYSPHEREARTKGVPSPGAGIIYPVPEEDIVCDPFEFPPWYKHFYALDVGWRRTAALWGAVDPETDILYWYSEYYTGNAEPPIHAAAIRARGSWIPGVIDPASNISNQKDGEALLTQYIALQLQLVKANNAVEAGIYAVWTRKSTGRLKVFRTCQNYLLEHRMYRRDENGKVHKDRDHLMDCERYGVMSGVDIATATPFDRMSGKFVNGLAVGKPKHEYEYAPMAASWNPQTGSAESVKNQRQSPWMPHKMT